MKQRVADYIADQFKEYGLEPFRGISFYQPFKIQVAPKRGGRVTPSSHKELDGYNVIGYAPAKNKNANYIIVEFGNWRCVKDELFWMPCLNVNGSLYLTIFSSQ